ncbi:hypothetical protein [Paraburkholderia aromaticivorans]|uniref:hypothetical protein n=1 Tax=Paraburkholderia aromaticivorans TaxID=2026199 RepID=UPI0012FE49A2|nr:hypothetical protein [Paraburkholderia aromaticivorans]
MREHQLSGIFVTLLITFSQQVEAIDWNLFPVVPTAPTAEDCRVLVLEHYENWIRPANERYSKCLEQKTMFGTATGGGRCKPSGITAWIQCVDLQEQSCLIHEKSSQEEDLCHQRATAVERAAAASKRDADRNQQRLADLIKKGKRIADLYSNSTNLITDPKAFLQKALVKSGQQALLRKMYPEAFGKNGPDREDLAQQAYESAWSLARNGSKNPVISEIQGTALDAIQREYDNVFRQLDSASVQLKNFTSEVASTRFSNPAPGLSPTPDPAVENRSGGGELTDCSILDNFAAASRLRDSDENKFLALTAKCTK